MNEIKVDVNEVIRLVNAATSGDIRECKFYYSGKEVQIPKEEIEKWRFIGLGIKDFVLMREWDDENQP